MRCYTLTQALYGGSQGSILSRLRWLFSAQAAGISHT
jgi:hypothetical protein